MSNDRRLRTGRLTVGRFLGVKNSPARSVMPQVEPEGVEDGLLDPFEEDLEFLAESDAFDQMVTASGQHD